MRVLKWAVVWQSRHKKVDPSFNHWLGVKEIFQNSSHLHFSFDRNKKRKQWLEIDNMQMRLMAVRSISDESLFFKYRIYKKYDKGAFWAKTSA